MIKPIGLSWRCKIVYSYLYEGRVLKNYSNPFLEAQLSNSDFQQRKEGFRAGTCVAPLWQQAFDWFRSEGYLSTIEYDDEDNTYVLKWCYLNNGYEIVSGFDTYNEAKIQLLKALIGNYKI